MELTTNGRHANYEMKLSGFDLDTSTNKVYGVVLTAADGSEYGLHHVTNIWRGTELGFNTDETYLASILLNISFFLWLKRYENQTCA